MKQNMIRNMTEGSISQQLLTFALPLLLANALQTFYTMVDTMVVGRFVGTESLAAVSTGSELIMFYTMVGMGIASAGQIIIAQFVGKDDKKSVSATVGALFSMMAIVAIVLSIGCYFAVDLQLQWLNMPEEAYSEGKGYVIVSAVGLIFIFGYNAVSAVLRGMGDSKRPLIFVAVASIANLLLDLLFVIGFQWGAVGAALATILGQGFSLVASLIYLYQNRDGFGFDFKPHSFLPERRYIIMLVKLGIPMAAQFGAILISVLYISSQVNLFGVSAAAANGVANKLENLLRIVSNSVGTAGSAMIAQNIAAKKTQRVTKILGWVLLICASWALICSVTIFIIPKRVFGIFNTDSTVLQYAVLYAPVGVVCYMGNGIRAAANGLINGIGFASLSLVTGLLDGVVARIGFALLFGYAMGMGLQGFWLGSALAGYVPIFVGFSYYLSGKWKTHKLITQ